MRRGFLPGIGVGIVLVLVVQWVYPRVAGRVYVVRSIESYHPHKNENAEVGLTVYEKGESGHVQHIVCEFPPDFQLQGDSEHGWTGIRRVRLRGLIMVSAFGTEVYRAEKVE